MFEKQKKTCKNVKKKSKQKLKHSKMETKQQNLLFDFLKLFYRFPKTALKNQSHGFLKER